MYSSTRLAAALTILSAAAAAFATPGAATAGRSGRPDSGTIYTGEIRAAGKTIYQAGSVTDRVFGSGAVTFTTSPLLTKPGVVHLTTSNAAVWTATGMLSGVVSADIHLISATRATVVNGKLHVKGRSGSQQGHSLVGTFTGTGNPTTTEFKFSYSASYH